MSFWEWAGSSDPTAVITAVLGPAGIIAALITWATSRRKTKVPAEEQAKVVEAVTAPAPDRDALWIARQALEAAAEASAKADRASARADRVTEINGQLWQWIRDVRGQWHVVRLKEDPPPEPIIKNQ
ncbi:hypothetical protein [Kocuria sp. CPCC 205297]|uniref:hypothetical protein n=1 Tax=Kocuria sp. CPCC 205297 TaxID=3073558 RepID=UPI0034D5FCD4